MPKDFDKTKDAYMNHYKVHYRVTEKPNALNGLTCRKVEFTIELDAQNYKYLMKELYYTCISGREILYYEILSVSIRTSGYWTTICNVAGTIYDGNRKFADE
jgi:hypothetical protein